MDISSINAATATYAVATQNNKTGLLSTQDNAQVKSEHKIQVENISISKQANENLKVEHLVDNAVEGMIYQPFVGYLLPESMGKPLLPENIDLAEKLDQEYNILNSMLAGTAPLSEAGYQDLNQVFVRRKDNTLEQAAVNMFGSEHVLSNPIDLKSQVNLMSSFLNELSAHAKENRISLSHGVFTEDKLLTQESEGRYYAN